MEKEIKKVMETIQDNSFAKVEDKPNQKHTENIRKTPQNI